MKTRLDTLYTHQNITGKGIAHHDWCVDLLSRRDADIVSQIDSLLLEDNSKELVYDKTIDITALPPELMAEMKGIKKGWNAALKELKKTINV